MEVKETLTLIGIGVTFIIGVANLIVSLFNTKKTTFINSVTTSRTKYIQEFRNTVSDLCGLVTSYQSKKPKLEKEQRFELLKQINILKYRIQLYLNPADEDWDGKILNIIKDIETKTGTTLQEKITELIDITQFLLKLEWEGVKRESEKGNISGLEKREMYNKNLGLYKSHITKK